MGKSAVFAWIFALFFSIGGNWGSCSFTTDEGNFVVTNAYADRSLSLEFEFAEQGKQYEELMKIISEEEPPGYLEKSFVWRMAPTSNTEHPYRWPRISPEQAQLAYPALRIELPPLHQVNFGFHREGPDSLMEYKSLRVRDASGEVDLFLEAGEIRDMLSDNKSGRGVFNIPISPSPKDTSGFSWQDIFPL